MLEKGMRVRVKSLKAIKETLDSTRHCKGTETSFLHDMEECCGREAVILREGSINENGIQKGIEIEYTLSYDDHWYWTEHWLEPFDKTQSISNPEVFLIGDKVRRDRNNWNDMEIGDEDEVVGVATTTVNLKHYGRGHDKERLSVIARVGDCVPYPYNSTIDHATLHSRSTPDDGTFGIGDQVKCLDKAKHCSGPTPPIRKEEVLTISKIEGSRFLSTKCIGANCLQGSDGDDELCLRLADYELVHRATPQATERTRKFGAESGSCIPYSRVCNECGETYGSHSGYTCPIARKIKEGDTVRYLGDSSYATDNGFSVGHVGIVTSISGTSSIKVDNSQWWMSVSCFEIVPLSTELSRPRDMKRGDMVRYIKVTHWSLEAGLKLGSIYTLSMVDLNTGNVQLEEDITSYYIEAESFELVDPRTEGTLGSVAKETLIGGKDMRPEPEDLEQICKQLNIEIVGTVEDGYYILKDGTIGYFNRETINTQLTQAQQRAIVKNLPDTINSRAFILEEHQLAFQSWKFVQTNQEEMEALQPTASPVTP